MVLQKTEESTRGAAHTEKEHLGSYERIQKNRVKTTGELL